MGKSMGKRLFIAEKPSVAAEFARVLKVNTSRKDGYLEGNDTIVTWCVGHLVTMSYPEVYDVKLKKWSVDTLPFLPREYKYEVIDSVKKQFETVKYLLNRQDVDTIYVCTDSGREGEYIYRLVDDMACVPPDKDKRRVWIDSQTEEEILRGIREAKPLSEYDNISDSAYLRAKEDYLMGINFSRILTLKYGNFVQNYLKSEKWSAISVGRVMTCVLGMVVRREREIREFKKTPFFRISASIGSEESFDGEFKAVKDSKYYESPALYKDNGFLKIDDARKFVELMGNVECIRQAQLPTDTKEKFLEEYKAIDIQGNISSIEKKTEKKNPPMLFNLAELQNECSKAFKISPDETLQIVQELYEKKLVTYPRTDARVLSSAVAKEIYKNIKGISNIPMFKEYTDHILVGEKYKGIEKTRYVNDSQITDHYAIIPTGQGISSINGLSTLAKKVYDRIVRRFLGIFYPAAQFQKVTINVIIEKETFVASFKTLKDAGYLALSPKVNKNSEDKTEEDSDNREEVLDDALFRYVNTLKKGQDITINGFSIKAGETSPPKRYDSGSIILTMEKAGQFIEDEELRAQIKGSGIGTSATRAEILKKLFKIKYLSLNEKTQIITPTLLGEIIYEVVAASIKSLLNAELTASWEKGLNYVAEGEITKESYMIKLEAFVTKWTEAVKGLNNTYALKTSFDKCLAYYKKTK